MTHRMRDVLTEAARQELRRAEGRWPAHPCTLAALVRHGLLERTERLSRHARPLTVWSITEAGRQALCPRERTVRQRPVYLSRYGHAGDVGERYYTTNPAKAVDRLEVVDEVSLVWQRRSEVKRLASKDADELGRRLARELRVA